MHICVCSLVHMSWLIVFLLSAGIVLKKSLTALKKLNDYEHEDFSQYAVTSIYELDRKYVLTDINRLSLLNGTFMSRGHVYLPHYIRQHSFGMCSK